MNYQKVTLSDITNKRSGYSQKALETLGQGKYSTFRTAPLASRKRDEARKHDPVKTVSAPKTETPKASSAPKQTSAPKKTNSVSLPVPTLPMVNAMQGDPRFQVQPEYNGDEVLNQLLGGVKSPVKESPNLSDMIPKTPRESDTKSSKAKPSTRYTNETEKDFLGGLMAEYADEHPFISTLNSLSLNVGSTVEGIENALSGFLGESLFNPEKPVSDLYARRGLTKDSLAATKAKEGIRQTVQDNIDNGFGKFAYNTGTGLADMGINMAISGGNPVAMGVVSGAQNAAQNTLHARERGVDADKARKTGLATGVVAGVMNSVGLDSVLKSTAKTVAGQVLQGAGKEGLENVVEDIADIWIDNIINGDNSETSKTIQYYVQNGMSEEEAYKKSFVDYLNQELVSFASGAALGGAIGGAKKLPQLGAYVDGKLAERDARKNPTVAGILDGTITESPRVPDVVEQARAQAERAQAEIERLNQQIPETPEAPAVEQSAVSNAMDRNVGKTRPFVEPTPEAQKAQAALEAERMGLPLSEDEQAALQAVGESAPNANTMQNVDFKPSIHNADGQLLDTVKVPEYTADSNVFFNGSDTDIAFAEAQDAAITDTFRNIVSDPEFNALSFKNGRQEVYVSPSTNGEGYRVSYTVDGVPTGHHDYSINEIDDLSQNLREMAGNGGEDIRIQKKSDLARQTAERPFTDMSPEEQAALQAELDNEYNFDANEVAANDTGIESNPTITERYPFPEKADGSRPDYHNVEEVSTRLETTRQSIAKNTEDIEALNKQLNDIPDLKKNAKERSALKNQIYQLEQQNKQSAKLEKILTKISEGKKVSNKDIFEVEFPDDYHAIFDGRGGFFGRVNMATKFAGDTPEAKALAQSIRDDIYAIAKGDFDIENLGGLLEKVYNLDRMAQETKADYRARGTGKNPSRVYKYDDFFAGTKNGIGDDFTSHVIQSLDKAYQIANNMTDIDTTSRVAEAAGESAPVNAVPTVKSPIETDQENLNRLISSKKTGNVETSNGQIIEKYSLNDMKNVIKEIKENGGLKLGDQLDILYKDGTEVQLGNGDDVSNIKLTNIDGIVWRNENTDAFYGNVSAYHSPDSDVWYVATGQVPDSYYNSNIQTTGESASVETPESVAATSNPTVPEATNDTGIDNRVPTAEQTPVETNRVPAVEQTTPANGDEKIRSFSERGSQDDTLPDEIRESLSEDKYRVVRNADVETRANELFDPDNLIQSRSNLKQAIDNHDPAAALLSYKLAKAYVDSGEYDAATDVIKEASAELTKSGQFTQAAKLAMMQNDPMAAMRSYMRDLEDLNKWGKKKYGKKWKKLELSEEDVSEFGKVTPGDAENLNNLVNKLNKKFGKEVHASFWDKVVGATKTSMLLNMRTQMRNIVSNTAMLPVRSISDRVSALGQNVAHLINPNVKVTQSLVGGTREQKKAAGELFESMKDSILGTNKMKDSNTAEILGHRQIFNDDFFARWIDNKTNGGIQKLNERLGADGNQSTMETLQNFTYWLMGDFGDTPFVKKNFENRLASYMKAQNIDNIKDVPDDAIALAIEESLKATFKDDNAFTKALQGVKQKTGKFGEIALPFVKTPANLAMRSIDYSPIGLINTFRKAKNGAEVNQVIDELAKNLTGTAMIYLGYKLREKGLLSGNYSEDKDEAAFQKQQGMLEHAFHIGDKYFTYDWLQPAAAPLEIGSVIFDAINNSDKENAGVLDALNSSVKGGLAVANSWIQSSPLQSLSDMLGNNPYGNEGVAENVLNEVIEFPQRLIPAQLGAIARSVDPTIRDTYIKDNTLTGIAGNQARQIVAKIPYLSKTLPASYDSWGNERTRTDTKWGGALAQNVNPGQLGNKNETPLDSEIQRLFDVTGRGEVFPISASRSLTLGEETVNMTNKEHSEYQKIMGEQSYEMADAFMNSAAYKDMTDEERVNTLDGIYKLSNSIAKEKIFNYTTDSDRELKEIYKTKGAQAAVDYLTQKSEAKNLGMSFSTYQKKEAEYEGGAEQYAQDKQTALDNGFVKSDGTANPDQYKKVMAQAGEHADKVLNDIPTLQSSGLPTSSYYTYAQAVNVVPSLSPSEFASTYKAIDTNPENAITQTEILEYINKKGYSQEQLKTVQDLWDMYKPSNSKKVPYLKDGIWKAKSK